MPPLAKDIYNPSVHEHDPSWSPHLVAVIARNMYRERRLACKITPRQHAKNYLRKELLRSSRKHILTALDSHSGSAYFTAEIGPICAGLPRTKVKVKVYGYKEQIFSTVELLNETEHELYQPALV